MHQLERDLSRRHDQETHSPKTLNLHPAIAELKVAKTTCTGFQQDFNSSPQSPMQQHRENAHRKHPTNVKTSMLQHFIEVQKPVKLGEKSDSHAKHFATQFHDANPSPANQNEGITSSLFWQGNPVSFVRMFATKNCTICEKNPILKPH